MCKLQLFTNRLDTDKDLKLWKDKFEERTAALESKIHKWEREKVDTDIRADGHKDKIKDYIQEISKLQTEAEVHALADNLHIQLAL